MTAQRALAVGAVDESLERITRSCGAQASAAPVTDELELDPEARRIYLRALEALQQARLEFLIGGAYALAPYTGVVRDTKDLDVFLRRRDCEAALAVLAAVGFGTELTFPHWLAKASMGGQVVDLIFSSGNGVALIDDDWFTHAVPGEVLGVPVLLCPPEEMIWSKAFIMERERYDGADVAHLILACGPRLNWRRLLGRFDRRWRVLLSHLILFGFIYPGERAAIPESVMSQLLGQLDRDLVPPADDVRVCDGTLLSRQQYLRDIIRNGYADGRLAPRGEMSPSEIAHWTAAISEAAAPSPPDPRADASSRPRANDSNGRSGSRARRRRR